MSITSESSGRRITSAEKLAKAIEARREGCTLDQCAERAGYSSKQAVSRALLRYHRRLSHENCAQVEMARAEECERLDAMLVEVWPKAEAGDLPSVDRVLKIIRLRCRLLGLYSPPQQAVEQAPARDFQLDLSRLSGDEISTLSSLFTKATST